MSSPVLMQGNEAIAEAAIRAGARFFAGYPITPSTEIGEIMAGRLPQVEGHFVQMEDEIASMAAVIGASLAGMKSLTSTSGPGFSLKQENLGYAIITETPCVVVEVQRVGPSTGIPTAPSQGDVMQARWGTHGDHLLIVLTPSSVLECYTETIRAFNLSERFRVPVVLLTDEIVSHMREGVLIPQDIDIVERRKPLSGREGYLPFAPGPDGVPIIANFGDGYRFHVTGLIHGESGFPTEEPDETRRLLTRLNTKLISHLNEILKWVAYDLEDAEVGIVAYGSVARAAQQALVMAREKGIKTGLLKLLTIWPFAADLVASLGERMPLLVPELNMGQLVGEVERVAKRVIPLNRYDGEPMTPEEILDGLEAM